MKIAEWVHKGQFIWLAMIALAQVTQADHLGGIQVRQTQAAVDWQLLYTVPIDQHIGKVRQVEQEARDRLYGLFGHANLPAILSSGDKRALAAIMREANLQIEEEELDPARLNWAYANQSRVHASPVLMASFNHNDASGVIDLYRISNHNAQGVQVGDFASMYHARIKPSDLNVFLPVNPFARLDASGDNQATTFSNLSFNAFLVAVGQVMKYLHADEAVIYAPELQNIDSNQHSTCLSYSNLGMCNKEQIVLKRMHQLVPRFYRMTSQNVYGDFAQSANVPVPYLSGLGTGICVRQLNVDQQCVENLVSLAWNDFSATVFSEPVATQIRQMLLSSEAEIFTYDPNLNSLYDVVMPATANYLNSYDILNTHGHWHSFNQSAKIALAAIGAELGGSSSAAAGQGQLARRIRTLLPTVLRNRQQNALVSGWTYFKQNGISTTDLQNAYLASIVDDGEALSGVQQRYKDHVQTYQINIPPRPFAQLTSLSAQLRLSPHLLTSDAAFYKLLNGQICENWTDTISKCYARWNQLNNINDYMTFFELSAQADARIGKSVNVGMFPRPDSFVPLRPIAEFLARYYQLTEDNSLPPSRQEKLQQLKHRLTLQLHQQHEN